MKGIDEWLASIGLLQYGQRFADNAIDLSVLRDVTEQDLKELGVLLGHRRKMLRAIAELNKAAPGRAATAAEPTSRDEAERRHLTVMICDLVGSTALSARLDPEDMRAVMDAYHAACARIMASYEGFLAEFRGDGILAYFGYPRAHEDDAERTVRAALDIIAAIARLETRAREPLAVRIGIATGLVLVGNLSGGSELREHAVVGDTPNVAARLQSLAEPGTIVVAGSTRRLLGNLFRLRDLGRHEVKGIVEPVVAWVVEGVFPSESRFEAAHEARLTAFIGREKEIDVLLERQRLAWRGEGQVVLISGEPGIGKSRLVAALAERIAGEPHTRLRYQCSPYHSNSVLRPFIVQLERAAGFRADDTSEQRLDKLEAILATGASQLQAKIPLFATLLSIPVGPGHRSLVLSPSQLRRQTLAALLDQFESVARRQPILLLFEDAHWADATSLELVDMAIERVCQLPVLAVFTFRPEFDPPWVGLPHVSTLPLSRLDHNDVENMVIRVAGGRVLPTEVTKQIVAKTDGNPLFVEELTKAVLEAGILVEDVEGYRLDGPLPPLAIPDTLQDSLMARLDRLAPVKEVSQIGAAIGREFYYPLVRALVGRDESALKSALTQLEEAELVFRHGDPPDAVYRFKHALVRDAAYESLLKSRRVQLHGQIARMLEGRFADIVASQPEIVAQHFTAADLAEPAVGYWFQAGQQAARRSANAEALNHLARGLELLPKISNPIVRNKSELLLQTSLGHSLRATKGWSIDSVKHAYTRALQLCKESGFDEHTSPAMFGLWSWNFLRAALGEAQSLAEYLIDTAEHAGDSAYKALAQESLGFTLFARGDFAAAHSALERSIRLCDDSKAAAYLDLSAQDPRVHARLYDGLILWMLGYPDRALQMCADARRYADTSEHPFSVAMARTISLRVHQLRGEAAAVADQANEAISLCEEHEFVHYLAMAMVLRGWATARLGDFEKGITEIQEGLKKQRDTGASLFESYILGLLADACIENERYGQALEFLSQVQLGPDEGNSERFYTAEIYRLLGEAHLRSRQDLDRQDLDRQDLDRQDLDRAETYLTAGLKIARDQKAKSLELKICVSIYDLAALRKSTEKSRSQLYDIYKSFSEGFDTEDLVKAKTRLNFAG